MGYFIEGVWPASFCQRGNPPQTLNPLEHAVFQRVFGEIMTLLIALEFNHTLQYVISRDRGIVQGKVIVLIAQLALARKVIVTDPYEVAPASVAALAGLALALGVTYWLMRGRDDDLEAPGSEKRVDPDHARSVDR